MRCLFLEKCLKIVNITISSHIASQTSTDDNLADGFSENDCINEASKPQVLNNVAVPLVTLELLEEQKKYDEFGRLILATNAKSLKLGFLNTTMDCRATYIQ